MKLNKVAMINLLYERFNGNFSRLARELGLDVAYVYRVLEKNRNCGAKFFSNIMLWCTKNNLDYKRFIFLP
jgi:hypothetical protein